MTTVLLPVRAGADQETRLRRLIVAAGIARCTNVRPWPAYRDGRSDVFLAAERCSPPLLSAEDLAEECASYEYLFEASITAAAARVDLDP